MLSVIHDSSGTFRQFVAQDGCDCNEQDDSLQDYVDQIEDALETFEINEETEDDE